MGGNQCKTSQLGINFGASVSGNAASWNTLWGNWIVEELIRCGLRLFCISPGSRSTPLTIAAARNPEAEIKLIYDERASAYYALGYTRATGLAGVLICTSGTAAANFLPAVVEASVEQIPMLILTADRPPELQQTGANQSINQNQLFGSHVRWFFDPGCPGPEPSGSTLLSCVDQAVHLAHHPLPGPVHLNLPFREPFLLQQNQNLDEVAVDPDLQIWKKEKIPWIRHATPKIGTDEKVLRELAQNLPEKGILSIGRIPSNAYQSVKKFAGILKWPVFADISSGLRLGSGTPNRITYFDQLLLDQDFFTTHLPQKILHLGFAPTSKRWLSVMETLPAEDLLWIKQGSSRLDSTHRFRNVFETSLHEFCKLMLPWLGNRKNSEWTGHWLAESERIEILMDEFISKQIGISEMSLTQKLTEIIPDTHALFLGNSLPVREVDFYGSGNGSTVSVGLNRGASGIDGLVASGTGYAKGLDRPLTLLLGDLSLLHDLNSIQLIAESFQPVVLIVLNNQGGGIFSFLPVSEHQDIFETYFSTPHSLEFEEAAKMFGMPYFKPHSMEEFQTIYLERVGSNTSCIIELKTVKEDNVRLQKKWTEFLLTNTYQVQDPRA